MITGKLRLRDDDYISDVYPKFFWADWYIHQTMFCVEPEKSGVIVGQKCIQLLGTALDDLFSKICFIKSSVNMLRTNLGVAQITGALLQFFIRKSAL